MDKGVKGLKFLDVIGGSIQTKTYSFALFTLVVVVVLVTGAIRPTVIKIGQINNEIKEKKIVEEQLDSKLNALATLSTEYATKQDDISKLPMIFPSQGNLSLLMSNVEEIAQSYGYELSGINFGSAEKTDLTFNILKPWSARMTVSGSKANFIKFLQSLETMPMMPIVSKVSYTDASSSRGSTAYSIELMIFKIDDNNFYK